ncbi:MAG: GAF domain-containing sensor histidine kinase [Cycloclasticus sp.]
MIVADIPESEDDRIRALHELDILDTLEEQAYDDLTRLAAEICHTPIALVSLVDSDRQWFKSHHGLDARETPREIAFCSHAILSDDVFVIEDSSQDERFADNPLATGAPHVTFYAGAPLIMSDNKKLGTLCVIDSEARSLSPAQKEALTALARQVVSQLELRLKVKELKKLDHAKDEFISMASHELRTPLTSIFGSLSLLLNNKNFPLSEKLQPLISIAHRNTERLMMLVNDMLELSKIESGQLELHSEAINLVHLAEKSVELNAPYCHECGTELRFYNSDHNDPILVLADEQRILQVLTNFISNSAKFTHDKDQIEIHIKVDGPHAIVEVSDHGPGISIEQQKLVFMKFKQLDTNINNKLPGTGLGLNISKHLIEQHQGVIGFESVPDVKTTFYFKLPLIAK